MPTVLIVEDDASTRKLLEHRLELQGYKVISAGEGSAAIDLAQANLPNLILMDIMLPDMDGAEAVRQIKEDPQTKSIPVIFISSMVSSGDPGHPQVVVGDISYQAVPKPINFDKLWAAIKQLKKQ